MKWIEERAKFQKRFDDLSQENIQAIITELNKAVGNYISKGGISQDPNNNPDYNTVKKDGYSTSRVNQICKGKLKTKIYKKFEWKYIYE